jgi:hypothetical protein
MKNLSLLVFAVMVMLHPTLGGSPAVAQVVSCIDCKDATTSERERIKAARAKFDLEMKGDTKRPWDGLDLGTRKLPPAVRIPVAD